jgi:hypothetical protein
MCHVIAVVRFVIRRIHRISYYFVSYEPRHSKLIRSSYDRENYNFPKKSYFSISKNIKKILAKDG